MDTQRVENEAYGAMLCRMIGALGRRVAGGDPEDLRLITRAQESLDWAWWAGVRGQLQEGLSFGDIARATARTRQSVHERWTRLDARYNPDLVCEDCEGTGTDGPYEECLTCRGAGRRSG